ncbi:MAG: hypothetical protein J6X49_18395 [Victivallales bacterium]|nr:hypothetical protein [Victivallales bacterium]
MSRISRIVKEIEEKKAQKAQVNFMGGISYGLNPLETLKMVAASSIFGEPQYYRDGMECESHVSECAKKFLVLDFDGKNATDVFKETISASLDYDFEGTIRLAAELRTTYMMRLNPQIIMVMAAVHPSRPDFDEKNPGEFRKINAIVMSRADEPAMQLSSYLYLHEGSKSGIPTVLKRSWAEKLQSLNAYQINKYKNAEAGMINTVRICHAKGELVGELMKNGTVNVSESEKTWENLRSEGMSFKDIRKTIRIPHMALLRNLRNILSELDDSAESRDYMIGVLDDLKAGVKTGKQFPFRYYAAYMAIETATDIPYKHLVLDALEQCVELSIDNMPKLKGKTVCLSDNSGSAWGAMTSEYGTVTVAEIGNLSSVIAARLSEEGEVGIFGDKLKMFDISKKTSVLEQARDLSKNRGESVGHGTENGIWIFFEDAIKNERKYDNIFIFSDQQAGHGELYGTKHPYVIDMEHFNITKYYYPYVDVLKLLEMYRTKVNPKVNFITVQTAGYTNAVIPEYTYRGAILEGWTGKEILFADEIIRQWDELDARHQ